eukprot:214896-Lingulodinium_polyedra.AAC.1
MLRDARPTHRTNTCIGVNEINARTRGVTSLRQQCVSGLPPLALLSRGLASGCMQDGEINS